MDEAAARELYEKHAGGLWLRFEHYYKYVFAFSGEEWPLMVNVQSVCNDNDVYYAKVSRDPSPAPEKLEWLMQEYERGQISNLETEEQWAWGR